MSSSDLPYLDEVDEKEDLLSFSALQSAETETIDLRDVLTRELTSSGSFNILGQNASFYKLLHALPISAMVIDKRHKIIFCNEACARLSTHYRNLVGRNFFLFFRPTQRASQARTLVTEVLEKRKPVVQEQRLAIENRSLWARIYYRPIRISPTRALLVIIEDLTLEKRQILLMKKIERAKKEWEQTVDRVEEGIAIVDSEFRITRLNKASAARAGVKVKEAVGLPCYRLFHGTDEPPAFCPLRMSLVDGREHSSDYFERHMQGHFTETIFPTVDASGAVTGCVLVLRDITKAKRLQEELKRQASLDSLTGLFNRRTVLGKLESALESARRYHTPLSVSICDIDNFKAINDTFGHNAGDMVLAQYGNTVKKELRRADFAGRFGGDEFVLVFPHTNAAGAGECMERIKNGLEQMKFTFESRTHVVTCSAGVAEFVDSIPTADDLVHAADQALYEAKRQGRNRIVVSGHHGPSVG